MTNESSKPPPSKYITVCYIKERTIGLFLGGRQYSMSICMECHGEEVLLVVHVLMVLWWGEMVGSAIVQICASPSKIGGVGCDFERGCTNLHRSIIRKWIRSGF